MMRKKVFLPQSRKKYSCTELAVMEELQPLSLDVKCKSVAAELIAKNMQIFFI